MLYGQVKRFTEYKHTQYSLSLVCHKLHNKLTT